MIIVAMMLVFMSYKVETTFVLRRTIKPLVIFLKKVDLPDNQQVLLFEKRLILWHDEGCMTLHQVNRLSQWQIQFRPKVLSNNIFSEILF